MNGRSNVIDTMENMRFLNVIAVCCMFVVTQSNGIRFIGSMVKVKTEIELKFYF